MSGPESFVAFCTPIQLKNNLVEKLRENFRLSLPNNIPMDLPPHFKKVLPLASNEFLEWLAGFTDAEGTFSIIPQSNWAYVSLNFAIEVHIDDIDVLHQIAKNLGIGVVDKGRTRPTAKFYVKNFEDIISVLIPIFKEFPLQTTKYLDFTCFMEAALIKLNSKGIYRGRTSYNNFAKTDLVKLKKEILELEGKSITFLKLNRIY